MFGGLSQCVADGKIHYEQAVGELNELNMDLG